MYAHLDFMKLSEELIRTRGNLYKLAKHHHRYDLRKSNFINLVIPILNSLSNHVVSAESVDTFNKCSAAAEMGDRVIAKWAEKWGAVSPSNTTLPEPRARSLPPYQVVS